MQKYSRVGGVFLLKAIKTCKEVRGMTRIVTRHDMEMSEKMDEWMVRDEKEDRWRLREDAPDDVKEYYEKIKKEYKGF